MAHPVQQKWCKTIKKTFPDYFKNVRVLDVGSLDVNGNNKHLFDDSEYIGLDVVAGKNVDVVCSVHEYENDDLFDVVLSTNTLEHDMYYELSLKKMFSVLKLNGFMFFSVANSWKEHGTIRTSPSQSGTSTMGEAWENYYKNLTPEDIKSCLDFSKFKDYEMDIFKKDLRFWGIKSGDC